MHVSQKLIRGGLAALLLSFAPALQAQSVADQLSGKAQASAEVFQKLLATQPKPALEELATSWIARLQGAAENAALTPSPATEDALKAALVRTPLVLDQLEAAGGDAAALATHREFVSRVSGAQPKEESFTAAIEWATSADGGIKWLVNIGLFLLTLIAFKIIASILGGIVSRSLKAFKSGSDLLRAFLVNTTKKVTFFIGLIIGLSFLGVPTGPFLAALGAAGFVIGFALQGTLNNFAAGIMILLYRPYEIGDFVTVGGVSGSVREMTLVSTTLCTGDNQVIVVPNGSIWGGVITNATGNDTRRVDFTFGIGYSDDIGKAQGILETVLSSHDKILKDPAPVIKVHELADSSVNFVVRPWVNTADYWAVYWDITRAVKEEFDKASVSIPFPQTDVHVHQVAAATA